MPRRTAAEKAEKSARYWKEQIRKAYGTGKRSAPLAEAVRWLYGALAQRSEESPGDEEEMYKWATDQLSGFAEQIQTWIITESKTGK
jgi:hypothetical protein